MTQPVADVLPKLVLELREDADVAAIVGANPNSKPRVRGYEAGPGDAQERESFRAFAVAVQLDAPRERRVPVQRPRIAVRCYGRTVAEAAALRWACSQAIHHIGPRVHSNGLGIYASHDDAGGEQEEDPDTRQPYQTLFVDLIATTQAVT